MEKSTNFKEQIVTAKKSTIMKVIVKTKSHLLDGYKGKVSFSVHTTHLFPEGMVKQLMPRIEKLIANEFENAYLLSNTENKQQ
jgi:hypothetical protein